MKNLVITLFILWLLSLHFYLYVPLVLSVALAAALVSAASVTLLDWLYRRRAFAGAVDRDGSLGL